MQMILFKMQGQNYLISADDVEEVVDTIQITKVPLASNWIKGLINLRGTVVTVVGLAELLGIPSSDNNLNILIMKNGEERKGLLIEEVIEVLDIDPTEIQLGSDQGEKHIKGVIAFPDKVANIVDVTDAIF
ncbi:chemotaxis protein CheW [Ligilactobacillus agilis]|uniref:Response regulator receiver modulated CheW protein n=1 Tax=Ligilactobacillus agilis TaxID=1601 RepID=A0A6F9XR82_9LACO|nr:chemotaxis protein CheW [Ligilactobacillus agilis]MDM8279957.1 chemotaxis protein CheW [Ligilactobacillus agilis]NJE32612.1 purine-binding chemotaxis protein CheW [Ligilactobacillus agilis]UNL43389.1 purine-binding chemotaxis protein CheW [Ligilactobacillus agilis]UNL57659.1 purine-binding chemotaxis protein CheW [Ligilactobacillus agilis]GET07707.1 response regulator receiver modulated CheW protein [Ligilactobacillus agilis]